MNTSKQTKPKVKLLTKRKYTVSPKATRKTNQEPLISVSNSTIASDFMEKAKEAIKTNIKTKTATPLINSMPILTRTSLKKMKWLKQDETLHFLPGQPTIQRKLMTTHINTLTSSLFTYGFLRPAITVEIDFLEGVKRLYLVDAQHGFVGCQRLGISVPYVVVPGINNHTDLTNLIAVFNSSSRSWKQGDYINAWSYFKQDYKNLLFLKAKYGLDFDVIMVAATGQDGGRFVKVMKAGEFTMPDFKKTQLTCQRVSDLLTFVPQIDRWSIKAITRAAITIFIEEGYTTAKHKRLMTYVKENGDQLAFCASKKSIALEFLRKGL